MSNEPDNQPDLSLAEKLNLETGKMEWSELQTYFARGIVIVVTAGQDLIETAVQLTEDNKAQIEAMIESGQLVRANDDHARNWLETDPLFWAVVVTPWVLVQEIPPTNN